MLFSLIIIPFIGIISLFLINSINMIRVFSLIIFIIEFILSLILLLIFDKSTSYFQFLSIFIFNNWEIYFGVDGISIFFIVLTTFLFPLCLLANWDNLNNFKLYAICLLIIESFLIIIFTTLNILIFFIFFESIVVPLFILIGLFGSGRRKVRSGFLFFFYTILGSILMFVSIVFIYNNVGTLNYQLLLDINISEDIERKLWLGFMLAFMCKVPVMPFHLWLPEAHVEAPTGGSVILAGILLKLGTYGILRYVLPIFVKASVYFAPLVYVLSGISVIYASFSAIRQSDMKRIIAYTSIAHMNLVVIGLFSFNTTAIMGSIFQMLSHGLVSSALFFCIGFLYNRVNTRIVDELGGLVIILPNFSVFFFLFTLANMGIPGTSNFSGEFLLFYGILKNNILIVFYTIISLVLSGVYSLWLYNRVFFGNLKTNKIYFDLYKYEFFILFNLFILILFFGFYPSFITDYMVSSVYTLIEIINFN